jgi:hypothetical protein
MENLILLFKIFTMFVVRNKSHYVQFHYNQGKSFKFTGSRAFWKRISTSLRVGFVAQRLPIFLLPKLFTMRNSKEILFDYMFKPVTTNDDEAKEALYLLTKFTKDNKLSDVKIILWDWFQNYLCSAEMDGATREWKQQHCFTYNHIYELMELMYTLFGDEPIVVKKR